ncbi:MAG: TIR domain-containing protein [Bacteroidota bacterium]
MEKSRIFIGSSVEGLDIAYAIQENLEFSAEVTIWDQGIFELTSTALDDLIKTLEKSDIGIFVFSPDDISKIRNKEYKTTRDNVIFELGLFIGYLGKNRVSFVIPRGIKDFHLPTDLTGITPGFFTPNRKDDNLRAALGPYCSQLKKVIEKATIIKLTNFQNDNEKIKRIVVHKPKNWEFLLTKEILKVEIEKLNRAMHEIQYDLYISKSKIFSVNEFINIISEKGQDFIQLITAFVNNYKLLIKSWGDYGEAGNEEQIRETALRMISFGYKALEIEKGNKGMIVPEQISDLKGYMRNWYTPITNAIHEFYDKLVYYFEDNDPTEELDFNIKIESPENIREMTERIVYYNNNLHLLKEN